MPLRSWVGQEPIAVTSPRPSVNYAQSRMSVDPVFGVASYMGPPPGCYWEIDAVQMELQTSANAGARRVWFYLQSEDGSVIRHRVMEASLGLTWCHMLTPKCGCGALTIAGNDTVTTSPCYVDTLRYPAKMGYLCDGFDGGTDIYHFHMLVKEFSTE
jgi:hypothetical protein